MAIKSSELQYFSSPSSYSDLTLVPKIYVEGRLLDLQNSLTTNVTVDGTTIDRGNNGLYVIINGAISSGNQGLVSGGTIFNYIKTNITDKSTASYDSNKKSYYVLTGSDGKIDENFLPAIAITNVSSGNTLPANTSGYQTGDVYIVTSSDSNRGSYIVSNNSWVKLVAPLDAVTSVNTKTGQVTLTASDVGAAPSSHTSTTGIHLTPNTSKDNQVLLSVKNGNPTWNDKINVANLPIAGTTTATVGGVYVDNDTLQVDANGKISVKKAYLTSVSLTGGGNGVTVSGASISVAKASSSAFGTVQLDGKTITTTGENNGIIQVNLKENGGLVYDTTDAAIKVTVDDSTIGINGSGNLYVKASYATSTGLTNLTTRVSTLEGYKHITSGGTENYVLTANSSGAPTWSETISHSAVPKAGTTTATIGGVYVDNDTLQVDANGKISVKKAYLTSVSLTGGGNGVTVSGANITVSTANASNFGTVKTDGETILSDSGIITASIPTWTSGHSYKSGAVVSHNKILYRSLNAVTESTVSPIADTTNWIDITKDTNTTYTKTSGIYSEASNDTKYTTPKSVADYVLKNIDNYPAYDPTATYNVGAVVVQDGKLYKCKTKVTTAGSWSTNSTKFQEIKVPQPGVGAWQVGTYYVPNDLVYYNGTIYECITANTSTLSNKPDTTPISNNQNTWWRGYNKYSGTKSVTSTEDFHIEVVHNLGTEDVIVQVYSIDSTTGAKSPVLVDYKLGDHAGTSGSTTTTITLLFANTQSNTQQYRVVVLAAK